MRLGLFRQPGGFEGLVLFMGEESLQPSYAALIIQRRRADPPDHRDPVAGALPHPPAARFLELLKVAARDDPGD